MMPQHNIWIGLCEVVPKKGHVDHGEVSGGYGYAMTRASTEKEFLRETKKYFSKIALLKLIDVEDAHQLTDVDFEEWGDDAELLELYDIMISDPSISVMITEIHMHTER